jgi:hypothetical protein
MVADSATVRDSGGDVMRARSRLLAILCLLLPLAFACSRSNEPLSRDGTVLESPDAGDRAKGDRVLAGQLRSVYPDKQTLVMAFGDDLYEFAYNDSTEIVGGDSKQRGLTGNTGNEITVHYKEHTFTSTKTAVRIELQ